MPRICLGESPLRLVAFDATGMIFETAIRSRSSTKDADAGRCWYLFPCIYAAVRTDLKL